MIETDSDADAPTPEVIAAVRAEERLAAERVDARLREKWGGDESGYQRGLAAIELVGDRLGYTEETLVGAARWLGRENALDAAKELGEALAVLPEEMTPAEAREAIEEIQTDRAFYARLEAGDRHTMKVWNGLIALAGKEQGA